jgi:UDP-glucose:(heptosyl)LPS alpha-1,3-glucosyltransferase
MKLAILKSRAGKSGGLEKYARRLADGFAARGCEVVMLTTQKAGEPLPTGNFEVVSLGKKPPFSAQHLIQFDRWCRKWLRENRCDLVFGMDRNRWQTHYRAGSGVHQVYLERRLLLEPSKRLSFALNPLHQLTLKYEREAFEHPDLQLLITNSEMVRGEVLDRFSIAPHKVQVVHNGVEWHEFAEPFAASRWSDGPYRFLFIGHDYRRKGLLIALEALAHLPGEWELTVVGKERRTGMFQREAEKLGIGDRVSWRGPQPSSLPFLQEADSLLLPSLYDPCANVTLEALAMGLHVVTSRWNGAHELLDERSGTVIDNLLHPESVTEALAHALQFRKTEERATQTRENIRPYDFANQLNSLIDRCLPTATI